LDFIKEKDGEIKSLKASIISKDDTLRKIAKTSGFNLFHPL
jgi:hypothetical protein